MTDDRGPSRVRTLEEMLAVYQSWDRRNMWQDGLRCAEDVGDTEAAARARRHLEDSDARGDASAVEALAAQHKLAENLAGWLWITMRAAREDGASWAEIAASIGADPVEARADYLRKLVAPVHPTGDRDVGDRFPLVARAIAAGGDWTSELSPDTPAEVVEEIDHALARSDVAALDVLQRRWWNPDAPLAGVDITQPAAARRARDRAGDTVEEATQKDPDSSSARTVPAVERVNRALGRAPAGRGSEGRAPAGGDGAAVSELETRRSPSADAADRAGVRATPTSWRPRDARGPGR